MSKNRPTPKDIDLIKQYLTEYAELASQEPQPLPAEVYDYYTKHRKVPKGYEGKLLVEQKDDGTYIMIDAVWDKWNDTVAELDNKYHDVVGKCLDFMLNQLAPSDNNMQKVDDLIQRLISEYGDLLPEEKKQQLTSILPAIHGVPINKLANKITDPLIPFNTNINLDIGKNCKKKVISSFVLTNMNDMEITYSRPVSEYDMAVESAVDDLWAYGDENHIFTPAQLYRAMVNATEAETPSDTQVNDVVKSLDKQTCIRITADCTEELKKRNATVDGYEVTRGKITTTLLDLDKIEIEAGGHTKQAYRINRPPFIHSYAKAVKQIETIPAELLDIRDSTGAKINNTKRRIAIKNYLIRHILIMKRTQRVNNIVYENMYPIIDNEQEFSKVERKNIREYIYKVLDYWKSKDFIKSYSDVKQGRSFTGVKVQL